MMPSPSPVQEIATVASSAQVPTAISDESPTRPGCLRLVPPVEVAAATRPCASRATAPTVFPRCSTRSGGAEPVVGGGVQALLAGEVGRGLADEHHVAAFVEDRARGLDRVADAA